MTIPTKTTEEQLALARNGRCAYCGGYDVYYCNLDVGVGEITHEAQCHNQNCEENWLETYTITRIDNEKDEVHEDETPH